MQLTREEAIANHRKMWNWISDETERWEDCTTKSDYFNTFFDLPIPRNGCYCCEYARNIIKYSVCSVCPLLWGSSFATCIFDGSKDDKRGLYVQWERACENKDWQKSAHLARFIANLPERKENGQ